MERVSDQWLSEHIELCEQCGDSLVLVKALRELQRWRQIEKLLRAGDDQPGRLVARCLEIIDNP